MSSLYYFAYGSNLHVERLRRRVSSAQVISAAVLFDYKLIFEKRGADDSGKCTIVPVDNETVQGVVYKIAVAQRPALDAVEGGYDCRTLVVNGQATEFRAYAYIARSEMITPGILPFHWYKQYVLHGARQHGLDADYCERIESQHSIDDPDTQRQQQHFQVLGIK